MVLQHKKRILIAEDEASLSRAMQLRLQKSGYTVGVAANGKAAKKELDGHHYDLILLDLIMPVQDGFAVLDHINQQHYALPVIIMTNLTHEEDKQRCRDLGAKQFIVKADISLREFDRIVDACF